MLLAPLRSAAYIIRPPRTLEGAVPDELRSAHRAARRPAPQGQLPLGSRDRHPVGRLQGRGQGERAERHGGPRGKRRVVRRDRRRRRMPARRGRRHLARRHPHARRPRDSRGGQGGARGLPKPPIAARHRGRRGGHSAHGGEEPDRVRLPYPRGAGARGRRRARRRPAARGGGQELASRRPVVSRRAAVPERGGDRLSVEERLERYVTELFAPEDPVLSAIRARHDALKLPPIHISPDEGKLLYVLLRAVAAARVLELGSLAGYSGVWLARALTARGTLTTIEIDARHAALARQAYVEAGVAERVRLIEGAALDVLPTLAPGFDAVFVDADKAPLAQYFEWSVRLLRPGGLLLCDNAFFHGAVVDPGDHSAEAEGVRAFNRLAASDPRVVAAVAPIRDGLVIGVKLPS
ncbi:MAG: hypothetical protein DMD65_12260 [Gemmatimonadetes bacterium]|nr:MAG: hypothetical protein DMD65_12260 [Gemmatimonadota bacterium]